MIRCKLFGHLWRIHDAWVAAGSVKVRCARCAQSDHVLDIWTRRPVQVRR